MPEPEYCCGKVAHPSRRVALENLARVMRGLDGAGRDRKERGRLIVYKCRHGCWHIGNHDPFLATADKRLGRRNASAMED